jgi:hypothetical protein
MAVDRACYLTEYILYILSIHVHSFPPALALIELVFPWRVATKATYAKSAETKSAD